jgi:hypothetical protein
MIREWASADAADGRRKARIAGKKAIKAARREGRAARKAGKAARRQASDARRAQAAELDAVLERWPRFTESYRVMILEREESPPES